MNESRMTKKNRPRTPDNVLVYVPMDITYGVFNIPKDLEEEDYTNRIKKVIRTYLRSGVPGVQQIYRVAAFTPKGIVSYLDKYDEAVWEVIWEVLQEPEFRKPPTTKKPRRKTAPVKRCKRGE